MCVCVCVWGGEVCLSKGWLGSAVIPAETGSLRRVLCSGFQMKTNTFICLCNVFVFVLIVLLLFVLQSPDRLGPASLWTPQVNETEPVSKTTFNTELINSDSISVSG